jgi:hypothetical protein
MADVVLKDDVEKDEKAEKEKEKKEREALEKKEKEKKDKELAHGPIFGGKVSAKESGENEVLQEVYDEGYTSLVVKCTRGEQKAELGDKAFQFTIYDEATGEDKVYLFVIPGPVIEHLQDLVSPVEPMTNQQYTEHQVKRAAKVAERPSHPIYEPGTGRPIKPAKPGQLPSPPPSAGHLPASPPPVASTKPSIK